MSACNQCGNQFAITNEDRKFLAKLSPVIGQRTYQITEPTLCPLCREQRRLAFRNDWNYYRQKCHLCRKSIVSIYSPDKPYKVLCFDCYYGDGWDPLSFGRPFDFSRPFFEQFHDLRLATPRLAIFNTQSDNSEYTVHSSRNRNCYMASSLIDCEQVHYSDFSFTSRDSMDLLFCENMELCYECLNSKECYNSDYLDSCSALTDSVYCFDCHSSNNLIGCVNMRRGEYAILNRPSNREEVSATRAHLYNDAEFRKSFVGKYQRLLSGLPRRHAWLLQCDNVSGNYLTNCKNTFASFDVQTGEDVRYASDCRKIVDCCDVTRMGDGEVLYECKATIDLKFSAFCNLTYQSDNLLYCDNCQATSNSFGCVGIKKQKHCLLNFQYEQSDYEQIVERVIAHMHSTREWGEFFPVTLSPFGYNETKAADLFPLTREEVTSNGWKWSDYEAPRPTAEKILNPADLPASVGLIHDDVCNHTLVCAGSGKLYRVIPNELSFYRKKDLSIPIFSPRERHCRRLARKQPHKLWQRKCAECSATIQAVYSPNSSERVLCGGCYLQMTV